MRQDALYIIYKVNKEIDMDDFDLEMLEAEMDAMTAEMSLEEIAEMEAEIKGGLDASFAEIFGGSN